MDKEECKEETAVAADHKTHQEEEENCNPFCSCACCGNILVQNFQLDKISYTNPFVNQNQAFAGNNSFFAPSFPGNIWQPPKFI